MALPPIASYPLPDDSELPASRPSWRLVPTRAALLIYDLQRYFIRPFDADDEPIRSMLANIAQIRSACHAHGIPVFYTAQPGAQPRERRGLQADFWGAGMSADAQDRSIVDALAPAQDDRILTKWRYSAFQQSDFETQMRDADRDQLIVTGVYAHIGCAITAADAFMRDIEPFFVADAVAAFSRRDHDVAIAFVAGSCGRVVSSAHVLEALVQ